MIGFRTNFLLFKKKTQNSTIYVTDTIFDKPIDQFSYNVIIEGAILPFHVFFVLDWIGKFFIDGSLQ